MPGLRKSFGLTIVGAIFRRLVLSVLEMGVCLLEHRIPAQELDAIPRFDRRFFESDDVISRIGKGSMGGKASGLAFAHTILKENFPEGKFEGLEVSIPRFVVVGTSVYDAFMEHNDLADATSGDLCDDRIANAFLSAEFPAMFAGDLRGLISSVRVPLAVRSSSMLEDAMYEPFAGVYGTKMIPNNQGDTETRYRKLVEAIKFVFASVFFKSARGYFGLTRKTAADEKMAVIIQEIVGLRHQDRFYPNFAGVARSFNFYPVGRAKPENGVVDLALGLGKTIVDGGRVWNYSPAFPNVAPPFTTSDLLRNTQVNFWAVNMGKPPAYDPVKESEYLVEAGIQDAEQDNTLGLAASTFQPQNDRFVMGIGTPGPRILNFAPLLQLGDLPVNKLIRQLLHICHEAADAAVEIEFAVTADSRGQVEPRFGFLQVRPMVVSTEPVDIEDSELDGENSLVVSERTLGNGVVKDITDIMYVKPEAFGKEHTPKIAAEIETLNRSASGNGRGYVLMGFGRWGSSDPWLGIPVDWGGISGARVIVEATRPDMDVEMSQGSHFFHNITSLQIPHFSVPHTAPRQIDWSWLDNQHILEETTFVRLVRLKAPVTVKVDGRCGRGVIVR